ncbi:MAG: XRE family transcriptional regulator [Dysgonamonadaceae bacterium]|nr:XRE family transcriptional regulator [Dysgonamonadaceae bacterium]
MLQTEYRIDLEIFIEVIVMLFADRIRRLRDEMQMLRWQFAATKDIDAPPFSKIERGKCHAKHEQVIAIAESFKVNQNDFLNHWLVNQVAAVVANEKELSNEVLKLAKENRKLNFIK